MTYTDFLIYGICRKGVIICKCAIFIIVNRMKTLALLAVSVLGVVSVSAFPSAQNMQAYRVGAVPQRVNLGYDGMHINGKPFVSCNHPAFKFGCAQVTYPRPFMTANDNRVKKATIVHKGLPMASSPNKDAFLEFAAAPAAAEEF